VSFLRKTAKCCFIRLVNNNQTDQGDETEGLEIEGLEREGVKEPYVVYA
jgi:hypothetical protein